MGKPDYTSMGVRVSTRDRLLKIANEERRKISDQLDVILDEWEGRDWKKGGGRK